MERQALNPKRTSTTADDEWCVRDEIIQEARVMKARQLITPNTEEARYLAWLVETDTESKAYVREDPLFFEEWQAVLP